MKFTYDTDADVMYISFGRPQPCKTIEAEGVHIRKTLEGVLNGITIINYSRKTSGNDIEASDSGQDQYLRSAK